MEIILLDNKRPMCLAWKKYFKDIPNVKVVNEDIEYYDLSNIDCLVSPANSYGLMDGGYDLALTRMFGNDLQHAVQNYIIDNLYGEQQVGSSIIIDIPNTNKKLIHTPTMRIPSPIVDSEIIYTSMRSTLMCALKNNIKTIIIPAFGGSTGMVPFNTIAREMYKAYIQIFNITINVHSWRDVEKRDDLMVKLMNDDI
jgi:O-acetyl-ADP-ribose deacetylase (regulator of RNase III)